MITCALLLAVVAALRGTWSPCGLSMISSINPFSEAARGNRYLLTCLWFVLGATLGGLALGGLAAGLSLVLAGTSVHVAAALALVGLAADLRLVPLPTHPRQVDEDWLRTYRSWVYGAGFGVQIGAGLATYIMTAATWVMVALAAFTSPVTALLVGAVFGAVRGLMVLLGAVARTPLALRNLHRAIDRLDAPSLAVAMAAQAAVAIALGGWWAGAASAVVLGVAAARRHLRVESTPTPEPLAV
jgi:hypothetical protein